MWIEGTQFCIDENTDSFPSQMKNKYSRRESQWSRFSSCSNCLLKVGIRRVLWISESNQKYLKLFCLTKGWIVKLHFSTRGRKSKGWTFSISASGSRHKTINCKLLNKEQTQERLGRYYLLSPQCDSHIFACGINQVQGPLGDFSAGPSGDSAHVISTLTHSYDICKER